jgi:hypothetical protein
MKTPLLSLLVLLAACNLSHTETVTISDTVAESVERLSPEPIPETRNSVKSGAVANYSEPIKDELNDWKFAVAIYETKRTFHYTIRIQAKEVRVSDSLDIPNFGIEPKIELRKGKEPLSCIIGFLDKKNEFKEYRLVSFRNDQLHFKTLNNYRVAAYKTTIK